MKRKKKNAVQQSMFRREENFVSIEEYREMATAGSKKTSHEKKFMNTIIGTAYSLDLPCVHIEYFCGNKFYPTCTGGKYKKHRPMRAVCPGCGQEVLAICVNRINKGLTGHFDILGIDWAIETKHKINKGPQIAKPSGSQIIKNALYEITAVPHMTVNESNEQEVFSFLRGIHNGKFPERKM